MTKTNRIVLDTNVLVSAGIRRVSIPRQAVDQALEHGVVLVSEHTIYELRDVLFRPKFDKYVSEQTRLLFLAMLLSQVEIVDITEQVTMCRDQKDDKFLEVAVSGSATHIISSDNDLLVLHPFRNITILTPQAYLTEQH